MSLHLFLGIALGWLACTRAGFDRLDRLDATPGSDRDLAGDRFAPAGDDGLDHDTVPRDLGCRPAWRCASWTLEAPSPVPELNSNVNETDPVLSADCLGVCFGSARPGGQGWDIWCATRKSRTESFGGVFNMSVFNSAWDENRLLYSTDGLQAFVQTTRAGGSGRADIWMATRTDPQAGFGPLAPVAELNSPANEVNFVVSQDGLRIYFAQLTLGSILFASRPSGSAKFSSPRVITELDSPQQEDSPAISADETMIVFSSGRPGGPGGADLYYARRRSKDEPFEPPALLPVVNSAGHDLNAFLACDDEELWFVSSRGGSWDIYRTRFVNPP